MTAQLPSAWGQSRLDVRVTATPASGAAPLTVTFRAVGFPPLPNNRGWEIFNWDFGDRGQATGPAPTHTYSQTGNYTVRLTYRQHIAGIDSYELATNKTLVVSVSPPRPPAVQVTANPWSGQVPLTVVFSAIGSPPSAPYSSPATYVWDFGDGTHGNGNSVNHIYSRPGNYRGMVTYTRFINVIDGKRREQATAPFTINVAPPAPPPARLDVFPPVLDFSGQATGPDPPQQSITLSNGGGSPLNWSLANGPGRFALSQSSGFLAPRQSIKLQVTPHSAGLTQGVHSAQLSFISPEAGNAPVMVALNLNLSPPPPSPTRWWLVLLAAAGGVAGIAFLARRAAARPRPAHAPAVAIKVTFDPGAPRVRLKAGTESEGKGPLVRSIAKVKGRRL